MNLAFSVFVTEGKKRLITLDYYYKMHPIKHNNSNDNNYSNNNDNNNTNTNNISSRYRINACDCLEFVHRYLKLIIVCVSFRYDLYRIKNGTRAKSRVG